MRKTHVREHVARGAALLDEVRPNWWKFVDAVKLDVWSPTRCPLALVTRVPYRSGCVELGLDNRAAYDLGFNAVRRRPRWWPYTGPLAQLNYSALTHEWRRVVRERQCIEIERLLGDLDHQLTDVERACVERRGR